LFCLLRHPPIIAPIAAQRQALLTERLPRIGPRVRQPEVILPMAKLADMNGELAAALQEQLDILWQTAGWIDGSPSFAGGAWAGYSDKQNYDTD
jgi:hypothetical protein